MSGTEVLQVLARRSDYGLRDGVWYLLDTVTVLSSRPLNASLCQRFGLSQNDLARVLKADCAFEIFGKKSREVAWTKVIASATSVHVPVIKVKEQCKSLLGIEVPLKCARMLYTCGMRLISIM